MGLMDTDHAGLVVAAQAGDDRAREKLIAAYLPLLYNIVGRALSGHADVDDVVQETLLRVVRDLPALRSPESFRSWLVSITLRQINAHWQRQRAFVNRTTVIDEALRIPDAGAEPEDATILRLHVSDERRQVVEARRWLDPDHRVLLSLWWQECAGSLSRDDIAAAMGLTVAHVGVRLQRMREQLELSRAIVAALEADPRCPQLNETVVGWDGLPASVWRKRIARHTRGCTVCTATTTERVPAELLLLSLAPLAVPAGLIGALAAKGLLSGTAASAAGPATAHVAVGTATGKRYAQLADRQTPRGDRSSADGPRHRRGAHRRDRHLRDLARTGASGARRHRRSHGRQFHAEPVADHHVGRTVPSESVRRRRHCSAGRTVTGVRGRPRPVPHLCRRLRDARPSLRVQQRADTAAGHLHGHRGLADTRCVTFRSADGRYLRHRDLRLQLSTNDGSELFREDATFCPSPGAVAGSVTLHAQNYPGSVLRHRDGGIWLDGSDGTRAFAGQASFIMRRAWATAP